MQKLRDFSKILSLNLLEFSPTDLLIAIELLRSEREQAIINSIKRKASTKSKSRITIEGTKIKFGPSPTKRGPKLSALDTLKAIGIDIKDPKILEKLNIIMKPKS